MSTFAGLSSALSSLYAQRRGLDVTGQNIANANTDGYTRQRVDLSSVGGGGVPAMYSVSYGTSGGVTVDGVTRLQDAFLEARARSEHAQSAYLADQTQVYRHIEQIFGEPGATGLQSQLAAFWSSWHDLANRPGDSASRIQVIQFGTAVANTLRTGSDTLGSVFTSTRDQLDTFAVDINTAAAQVAQLNNAIVHARQAQLPDSELADQRDGLVLHLSELTGATALARADGSVDLLLSGSSLVRGTTARQLASSGAHQLQDVAADPVRLQWVDSGVTAGLSSGQLVSTLETLNTTLARYSTALDQVAANLTSTVNTQHAAGYDLAGVAGGAFFSGTTAGGISLAITDPAKIAAAVSRAVGGGGTLDGSNADAMAALAGSATGPDRIYRQVVVALGTASQTLNRRSGVQRVITEDVDAARQAESGVNLDEEMTNMISFQRSYEAASRVITTVDSMLDTLINRTGLVGR